MDLAAPPIKKLKSDSTIGSVSTAYIGYRFPDATTQPIVERINWQTDAVNSKTFFHEFIGKRKPCVIQNFPFPYEKSSIVQELQSMETKVQVEQRLDDTERFGQRRTKDRQITMTIAEFLRKKSPLLYLSTQESHVDGTDDNHDTGSKMNHKTYIPPPFYGPPCNRLQRLPQDLECSGNLRLASCHLWMGHANKAHSGLHHDFHDNFYVLLAGRKHFRIYSPADAPFMAMHGENPKVHFNGLISYPNNPSRPDGIPIMPSDNDTLDIDDTPETQCVIGKGFDYESADEEAGFEEGKDDFSDASEVDVESLQSSDSVPCHFSWIDPTIPKDRIVSTYPLFQNVIECSVELVAGEVLFLPASWFHCVTSHKSEADSFHVAVNYWYYPPVRLNNFECPYQECAFQK